MTMIPFTGGAPRREQMKLSRGQSERRLSVVRAAGCHEVLDVGQVLCEPRRAANPRRPCCAMNEALRLGQVAGGERAHRQFEAIAHLGQKHFPQLVAVIPSSDNATKRSATSFASADARSSRIFMVTPCRRQ